MKDALSATQPARVALRPKQAGGTRQRKGSLSWSARAMWRPHLLASLVRGREGGLAAFGGTWANLPDSLSLGQARQSRIKGLQHDLAGTHRLESRMREIRPSGSEGGARVNSLVPTPIRLRVGEIFGLTHTHPCRTRILDFGFLSAFVIRASDF